LFFAVDTDFPLDFLPPETGLIVAADQTADLIREAPEHKLSAARRTALLRRWALLAGSRLAVMEDPSGVADLRASLRVE
jgi:hypothetical protein